MRKSTLLVLAFGLTGLLLGSGCDKKDSGAATPAASTAAPTPASAKVDTSAHAATASAAASASAAPAESASAGPAGAVHLHVDSVKATSGKVEGAERKFKSRAAAIRKKCLDAALKKEPAIDGTLKLTFELSGEGKVTKTTPKTEGKVPDDLVACIKTYVEKELEFDTDGGKAKLDVQIAFGPNVKTDK